MRYLKLTLVVCILESSMAFGEHRHCDGLVTHRVVLESSATYTSAICEETIGLNRVRGPHDFSFGRYVAEYWQGQYQRPAEQTLTVQYNIYTCWGDLVSAQTLIEKVPFYVKFNIKNLNLGENATWADIKTPMTDEEALSAFAKAKWDCEDSNLTSSSVPK